MKQIPLTLISSGGGCASKIGPDELEKILGGLNLPDEYAKSVINNYEDAGFIRIDHHIMIAQSIDVITPVSDDPSIFGAIATAHALSDLYAKGAKPVTGLIFLGIPSFQVPTNSARAILQGAIDKLTEAKASMLGGHTISSKELLVGLAVTGIIGNLPITNTGCKEGDALILTKPLGSGIIVTALKLSNTKIPISDFTKDVLENCQQIMLELNSVSSEIMMEVGAHACTDITGFGFIGHLTKMLSKNGLSAEIKMSAIPVMPGAIELASQDIVSAGCEHNAAFWWEDCVYFDNSITRGQKMILFDPQTSGGLLISIAMSKAQKLINKLRKAGVKSATIIGKIGPRTTAPVIFIE